MLNNMNKKTTIKKETENPKHDYKLGSYPKPEEKLKKDVALKIKILAMPAQGDN